MGATEIENGQVLAEAATSKQANQNAGTLVETSSHHNGDKSDPKLSLSLHCNTLA
jgi:hypothetical protein